MLGFFVGLNVGERVLLIGSTVGWAVGFNVG